MKICAAARLRAGAKELKAAHALIEKKLAYYTKAVREMESEKNNSSARDIYHKLTGIRDALDAVDQALKGNTKDLNML